MFASGQCCRTFAGCARRSRLLARREAGAGLTLREAEVLYWVAKGKTNRDIGDILGSSPATVKKHLERVYVKLGVETRTAAASITMSRLRQLNPGMTA